MKKQDCLICRQEQSFYRLVRRLAKPQLPVVKCVAIKDLRTLFAQMRFIMNTSIFSMKSKTDYLNSLGRGATFKEISKSIVENIEIPLPEVNQQKEIAEKFKKLEQLISLRKQQLAKLDELVKARFVEMFGDATT